MPLFKLLGFTPDLDKTTPGACMDVLGFVPSTRGMELAPWFEDVGLPNLGATSIGAAVVQRLDYSTRFFVSTSTDIYEAVGVSSWTNVGSSIGAGTADFPMRFAQFGDTSLAINPAQTLLSSGAVGTAFSAITGGPRGAVIETVNQFVFVCDTDLGDDYWQCCSLGDPTDWTASVVTQAANGRLTSAPGRITAAKQLGDNIVLFKRSAMFLGHYVGGTDNTWAFEQIPGNIGVAGQESIVSVGHALFFVDGECNDFWMYDGSRPVSIGKGLKEYVNNATPKIYINRIKGIHDKRNERIWWFVPGSTGRAEDDYVLNYRTMQWGRARFFADTVVSYITANTTYTSLASEYSTYNDLPTIAYDSPFWASGEEIPAFIWNGTVYSITGDERGPGLIRTHLIGNDNDYFTATGVKVHYLRKVDPTGADAGNPNFVSVASCDDLADTPSATINDYHDETNNRFDFIKSNRWFQLSFYFLGNVEFNSYTIDLVKDGTD